MDKTTIDDVYATLKIALEAFHEAYREHKAAKASYKEARIHMLLGEKFTSEDEDVREAGRTAVSALEYKALEFARGQLDAACHAMDIARNNKTG